MGEDEKDGGDGGDRAERDEPPGAEHAVSAFRDYVVARGMWHVRHGKVGVQQTKLGRRWTRAGLNAQSNRGWLIGVVTTLFPRK